jgi:uroporphyrinogen III methyltransferase/synthase
MGPGTAAMLNDRGITPDVMPDEFIAEGLAGAIIDGIPGGVAGKRVLLFRAEGARSVLPESLVAAGAVVDDVSAYRAIRPEVTRQEIIEIIEDADFLTFTSGSTATNLGEMFRINTIWGDESIPVPRAVSIGPVTTAAARNAGFQIAAEAREYTIPGLVRALVEHIEGES